jgi:phospholipase C
MLGEVPVGKSARKRSLRKSLIASSGLGAINHFVVLMLENRSFDHMLGYMQNSNPAYAGMAASDFNYEDPRTGKNKIGVGKATATALAFDPAHEFPEVQIQLYGPAANGTANPPSSPAPMSGFAFSSLGAKGAKVAQVMGCFEPSQIPVFTKLADEFAAFNFWYSPLPGATWPNRFFVHAGTSGGLSESPSNGQIVAGFDFPNGTIYERLEAAGRTWRIYYEDMPQALGVWSLRSKYLSSRFRGMSKFYRDVAAGSLPDYVFIEPWYDVFHDYVRGNSLHPHNDVSRGEQLIKDVYEAIRNSTLWPDTMLVITFDEHGGFYDHLSPPAAPPTGDDRRYASKPPFKFDRYGVRVPTVVVSAHTERQTVVGSDPADPSTMFDHCSIPATVRKRFGLKPLSKREEKANTLDVALNRTTRRDQDAPRTLPVPPRAPRPIRPAIRRMAATAKKLTKQQEAFLALAVAMDRQLSPGKAKRLAAAAEMKRTPEQAAAFAERVQAKALARRSNSTPSLGRRKAKSKRKSGT